MFSLTEQVQQFFDKEGPLSSLLLNYEPRAVQLEMALAIVKLLETEKGRLIVEAGTGTGKSFAYLAVALLADAKVLISTATKTLQDQLYQKDLPLALKVNKALTGQSKHVMLMKGRSNYLCLLKAKDFRPTSDLFKSNSDTQIVQINNFIAKTTTGDRSEIPDLPDDSPLWLELSTTSETCLGQECPLYSDCFITKMRKEAQSADVIIVNHALLCADRSLRIKSSMEKSSTGLLNGEQAFAQIIPDMDFWIVDEAHAITDIATRHFGFSLSIIRIHVLCRDLLKLSNLRIINSPYIFRACFDDLALLFTQLLTAILKADPAAEPNNYENQIFEKLNLIENALQSIEAKESEHKAIVSALIRRVQNIRAELKFMLSDESKKAGFVTYVEKDNRGLVLTSSPVDAAEILANALWSGSKHTILTSASLAVNGKLDSFLRGSGFSDDKNTNNSELILPTMFDFANQSAFYVPEKICAPNEMSFQSQLEDEIRFLISLAQGGTLLLFTSNRVLDATYQNMKQELEAQGLQVFKQGDAPKLSLLRSFNEADEDFGGVLFATHSFWEGVDVQGKALRLVVIDRLPFRSPEDPILKARTAKLESEGRSAFALLSLPEAALSLKQGAGRLLRTKRDAGIVAVLDNRIYQKSYGRVLLNTLPPMHRIRNRTLLKDFWKEKISPHFC